VLLEFGFWNLSGTWTLGVWSFYLSLPVDIPFLATDFPRFL
jgi:hypothetical protein